MSDELQLRAAGSDVIEAVFEGYAYPLAAGKFACGCGGTLEPNGFQHTTEVEGVRALGLGTTCDECGEDTLHIAYPGEPA